MRRRAFNQGGSTSRWFATKGVSGKDLLALQEAGPESKASLENYEQMVKDGAAQGTAIQETSLENEKETHDVRKSPSRRPLPLSPLMDPSYHAAKQKHTLPKAPPSKETTPLQKQLAKNPYAQALASPLRMCSQTRTHLPSYFLQDFELISHPATNEAWYLPRSLTSKYSSTPITDPDLSTNLVEPNGVKRGSKAYVLARKSLIHAIGTTGSGYTNGFKRFAMQHLKGSSASLAAKARWRGDMDTLVLDLMRRRIVEILKYLCEKDVGYLLGYSDWDSAKHAKQAGAFLWTGKQNRRQVTTVEEGRSTAGGQGKETADGQSEETVGIEEEDWEWEGEGGHSMATNQVDKTDTSKEERFVQDISHDTIPGEFATLDRGRSMKSKTPVHNLQYLLGDTLVEDLREHIPLVFGNEIVALKHKKVTIDMQLRLWKLQGYLAEYKQVDGE